MITIVRRNTIQKTLVLESVRAMSNHPTADEIYDLAAAKCPTISKGTVYRNLSNLVDEGLIKRVEVANAPDRYDYKVVSHCHFKCLKCGKVFDYTMSQSIDIEAELNSDFCVKGYELTFNGFCKNCREES